MTATWKSVVIPPPPPQEVERKHEITIGHVQICIGENRYGRSGADWSCYTSSAWEKLAPSAEVARLDLLTTLPGRLREALRELEAMGIDEFRAMARPSNPDIEAAVRAGGEEPANPAAGGEEAARGARHPAARRAVAQAGVVADAGAPRGVR